MGNTHTLCTGLQFAGNSNDTRLYSLLPDTRKVLKKPAVVWAEWFALEPEKPSKEYRLDERLNAILTLEV